MKNTDKETTMVAILDSEVKEVDDKKIEIRLISEEELKKMAKCRRNYYINIFINIFKILISIGIIAFLLYLQFFTDIESYKVFAIFTIYLLVFIYKG